METAETYGTLPKSHISASQINTFLRCPAAYYFRYCENLILPPKSALTRGKCVHRGQEHNYRQKIETAQDLPLQMIQDVVSDEFEASAGITEFEPDEDKGKVKDETVSLASLYHREVAPQVQPVLVEERVEVEFDNADYTLLGFIDVLDSEGFIRDTKTASKSPNAEEASKNLQLTAYALAHRHVMGRKEAGVKMDYLVVATKTPKVVTLQAERTGEDIDRFLRLVGRVTDAIRKEAYYPNPSSFLCSPKWCGFWDKCRREM